METNKIYVNVDRDAKLIDKLCRVAFENSWEINEWVRPRNLSNFTDNEMQGLIKKLGNYHAPTLVFTNHKERGILEIIFLRFEQKICGPTEAIKNAQDEVQLQEAIDWIKAQKEI